MVISKEQQNYRQWTADICQDQRIGHHAQDIATDIIAGLQQHFPRRFSSSSRQLVQRRSNIHRHIHDRSQSADNDRAEYDCFQIDRVSRIQKQQVHGILVYQPRKLQKTVCRRTDKRRNDKSADTAQNSRDRFSADAIHQQQISHDNKSTGQDRPAVNVLARQYRRHKNRKDWQAAKNQRDQSIYALHPSKSDNT